MEPEGNNEIRTRDGVGGAERGSVAERDPFWGGIWRPAQVELSLPSSHPFLLRTRAPKLL